MVEISQLTQLGFIAKTSPAPKALAKNTVTSAAEQKLKLTERGQWLKSMIAKCAADSEARHGFEQDLANLRNLYKNIVSDEEIQARCQRLADLKKSLNLTVTDSRQVYRRQTDRAVAALCGGAV